MTAGSGISTRRCRKAIAGPDARLPAVGESARKFEDDGPRYQDIPASAVPEVTDDDGTRVRVICGEFWGKRGPVEGVAADPSYVDVSVAPNRRKRLKIETSRNAFAYVFAGFRHVPGCIGSARSSDRILLSTKRQPKYDARNHSLVLFDRGDEIAVQAGEEGIRFLFGVR